MSAWQIIVAVDGTGLAFLALGCLGATLGNVVFARADEDES